MLYDFLDTSNVTTESVFYAVMLHYDRRFRSVQCEDCRLPDCRYITSHWHEWVSRAKKLFTNVAWNPVVHRYEPGSKTTLADETFAVYSYNGQEQLENDLGDYYMPVKLIEITC